MFECTYEVRKESVGGKKEKRRNGVIIYNFEDYKIKKFRVQEFFTRDY